jgi:DNA-binding response OmpR family regulator
MTKLRVAVLEDDPDMLDRLVRMLKSHPLVEVVASSDRLEVFEERVRSRAPQAMLLDIEIHGDKSAGLAIARKFKLPVLFISGRTQEDLRQIEELKRARWDMPIEPLTKPFDADTLKRAIDQFIRVNDAMAKPPVVVLRDERGDGRQVRLAEIVLVRVPGSEKESDKRSAEEIRHSKGQNREVLFTSDPPMIATNLTMERMEDFGFPKDSMIPISRSAYVNPDRVVKFNGAYIVVEYIGRHGSREKETMKVAEGRLRDLKARLEHH